VAPSRPELPDDQTLLDRVRDALLAIGFDEVGVEVEDGRITLLGWVRDRESSSRIERLVRNVAPDAMISNHLHISA
jgi:osmotically-inducible protein OsmY